jgi:predicted RNase H-like HicB family nuclease
MTIEGGNFMKRLAILHPAEEGGYWAEIPSLPGCVSEGDTFEEAVENIREAALAWIDVATDHARSQTEARLVEVDV